MYVLLAAVPAASAFAARIEAVTRPSEDVTLSFVGPGRIEEILVKEGDTVTAGQVLARQDDAAERVRLEQLKAEAEDDTRIKAAKAQAAQKEVDLKKTENVAKRGAATDLEVEHARLEVTIAKLSLALARFQQAQHKRKYEEATLRVDRMTLKSPSVGRVEELFVRRGESVDALEKAVRVVKVNPLWADVPVPLDEARSIRPKHAAEVTFGSGAGAVTVTGRAIHVAAVADAASGTRLVRVEVPNDFKVPRPAGERVKISFPGNVAEAPTARPAGTDKKESGSSNAKE